MEPCAPPAWCAFWKHPVGEVPVMGQTPRQEAGCFHSCLLVWLPLDVAQLNRELSTDIWGVQLFLVIF